MYHIIITIIALAVVGYLLFAKREEFCQSGDKKHCPSYCSPFLYPDMYSPQASCSDPFAWGFTYSTGRCPKAYPQRRVPQKK